jgi:hypothetical protein
MKIRARGRFEASITALTALVLILASGMLGDSAIAADPGLAVEENLARSGSEKSGPADASDVALTRSEASEEFFFIHISDAHVYDRKGDFQEFSSLNVPWFVPDFLVDWITILFLERFYDTDAEQIGEAFRDAVEPYYVGEVGDLSPSQALRAYNEEFARPDSELGNVVGATRAAIREVASLGPEFIVNTGDLVLESNKGSADAVERWFRFFVSLVEPLEMPVYNTIGNNEIAGIENDDFPADDPRFGKYFFEKFFGPTHFSFDHGDFHFVALDTHRPEPESEDPKDWSFNEMAPEVSAWADADFGAHRDQVLVALNHEPFHWDPDWPFENRDGVAQDEGLFARHRVAYVLSGHTHWKSFMTIDGVHHLTTGALSGLRWVMPVGLHERGYRLFYARDRHLYSAWKATAQPVVVAAQPASTDSESFVIVAADVAGRFESIEARSAGARLETERWGDYFAAVALPREATPVRPIDIELSAIRTDGSRVERMLRVPTASP